MFCKKYEGFWIICSKFYVFKHLEPVSVMHVTKSYYNYVIFRISISHCLYSYIMSVQRIAMRNIVSISLYTIIITLMLKGRSEVRCDL